MTSQKKSLSDSLHRYRVDAGRGFRLRDYDPADTGWFTSDGRDAAKALLRTGVERLAELQDKLFAQDRWALLLIFQAMDAAGKDGVIRHVFSGLNPQGCQTFSFGVPSEEELDHDYLWRCASRLPERGRIGIFNRSYYEEVLVVRVHQAILASQKIPSALVTRNIWKQRFEDIRNHEQYLTRNGIVILKFFLNLSKGEQKQRFLARLDEPEKNWKFSDADLRQRQFWRQYQGAYEEMIRNTSTSYAPWFVIPADHKWYTRLVVAEAVADALSGLKLRYPQISGAQRAALRKARAELLAENHRRVRRT
jgi:PPK2 family polyphosphate:nucleotide phosphotransferase